MTFSMMVCTKKTERKVCSDNSDSQAVVDVGREGLPMQKLRTWR